MTLVKFKKFVVLSAVATVTVAASAQAQNAASSDVATLEEIVVTAQRRSESLQDVPIAITVATKEQIERDQIYSLTDLQRVTPALEVTQTFGGESTGGGRIRGVGTNVFNQTATGSVAIVVDQVPQGNASFPRLAGQLFPLLPYPAEFRDRISPCHLQARRSGDGATS